METAQEMRELAMSKLGHKKELDSILEQIKEQAEAGFFNISLGVVRDVVLSELSKLGYSIFFPDKESVIISW